MTKTNSGAGLGSTYRIQFSRREDELERQPEGNHEDDEEWKDERGLRRLHDPEDGQPDALAEGEQVHLQGSDLVQRRVENALGRSSII